MNFVEGCAEEFKDINDWLTHKDQYCKSKKIIDELNKNSSGALFEVNCFADKTNDEIVELVGTSSEEDQGNRLLWPIPDESTVQTTQIIPTTDRSIDWVKAGKVSPVKHQHHCASCSIMTGTLVLESMYAIKHDQDPVPLSV